MDQNRFDDLTRALARGTSRRQALKLLGGGLAGSLLAFLGVGEAAADDCKRNGKACKKNKQCCSGNCANGFCAPLCPPCDACSTCSGGTCVSSCGSGETCDPTGICVPVPNLVICTCEGRVIGSCPVACADGLTHCTDLCAEEDRSLLSFTCGYEPACQD
jgi:hypothetical protein